MTDAVDNKEGMLDRFLKEMREYLIISIYLWICFRVLLLYKTAVLQAEQVEFVPLGIAVVKALIIGKFILIEKVVKAGSRFTPRILLTRIMWKSLAFMLLLTAFTLIEKNCPGLGPRRYCCEYIS